MLSKLLIYLDNLGFWIDTIHCYAHREQTGQQEGKDSVVKRTISQTEVDADKSDIRPQIIMLCTGDDNPNDPVGKTNVRSNNLKA